MNEFFIKEVIKNHLSEYITRFTQKNITNSLEPDSFEEKRNELLILMLSEFMNYPAECDASAELNIDISRGLLIKQLKSFNFDFQSINLTFVTCARFALERFVISNDNDASTSAKVKRFITYRQNEFDEKSSYEIDFIIKEMPLLIFRKYLTNRNVTSYMEYNKNIEKLNKQNIEWVKFIEDKEETVKGLAETLEKHETAFNFVGLHDGFERIGKDKKKELNTSKKVMVTFGILLIIPLFIEIIYIIVKGIEGINTSHLITLLPVFSITAIFVYFFRISLSNFQSIKAQLVQIELRKSLCQFIQSYAEYAHEIKGKDKDLLVKFEEVVFSNIMASEDKIPSTFDGLEQIASLVSSFKK